MRNPQRTCDTCKEKIHGDAGSSFSDYIRDGDNNIKVKEGFLCTRCEARRKNKLAPIDQ
jgi:hypothetical protein